MLLLGLTGQPPSYFFFFFTKKFCVSCPRNGLEHRRRSGLPSIIPTFHCGIKRTHVTFSQEKVLEIKAIQSLDAASQTPHECW